MIEVSYSRNFLKSAQIIPAQEQQKLGNLIEVLQENPFAPQLHTKRLAGPLVGLLSFRISRDWRVIFQFLSPRSIQLVRVVHRKDAYR